MRVPIKATKIFDEWAKLADRRTRRPEFMEQLRKVLDQMHQRLGGFEPFDAVPPYVFGLMSQQGEIKAVATVSAQVVKSGGEFMEEVEIDEIVVMPDEMRQQELAEELIRKIKGWAGAPWDGAAPSISMIFSGPALLPYYESLGMKPDKVLDNILSPMLDVQDMKSLFNYRMVRMEA